MILAPHNTTNWAQNLFGSAPLGDKRRTDRLVTVAAHLARHTGQSVASACEGDEALVEGAYRFIRNDNIGASVFRLSAFRETVASTADMGDILAMEDTTSLSYRHEVASELGKLGKSTDKSRGWWVHSVLLVQADTLQTIGLAHQEWWCRPNNPNDADLKESGKWETASTRLRSLFEQRMKQVISVCDRESDIFDYLVDKQGHNERFVVRGKHLRAVEEEPTLNLLDYLKAQPVLGGYQVSVPQKGMADKHGKKKNRPARKASLEVKTASVTFTQKGKPVSLNAVWAEEISPPSSETGLRWLLLTSEPVATLSEALRVIRIYAARWRIEDFHKAWKTGCGAERQRMAEPENLERVVSILAFVAVRLMQLRESFALPYYLKSQGLMKEAAQVASLACDRVLVEDEWRLLAYLEGDRVEKGKIPTLEWAYKALAKLGGFTDTKRTGIAGWDTLWKGWNTLQDRVSGYRSAREMMAKGIELGIEL